MDKLLPVLNNAGFSHVYAAGLKKKHGCLIAFDKDIYFKVEERVVHYDEQEFENGRRGSCIRTANIASLVALKCRDDRRGVIVATTHLFWHPK